VTSAVTVARDTCLPSHQPTNQFEQVLGFVTLADEGVRAGLERFGMMLGTGAEGDDDETGAAGAEAPHQVRRVTPGERPVEQQDRRLDVNEIIRKADDATAISGDGDVRLVAEDKEERRAYASEPVDDDDPLLSTAFRLLLLPSHASNSS